MMKDKVIFEFLGKEDTRENRVLYNWEGYDIGYRVILGKSKDGVITSIPVTKKIMEDMGASAFDLLNWSYKNMPRIFPLSLTSFFGAFYVLTNEDGFKGAASILYPGAINKIFDKGINKFYLIPSSIHEWLVVPDDGKMAKEDINSIINDVNKAAVAPEDRLGDKAMYFNGREFC